MKKIYLIITCLFFSFQSIAQNFDLNVGTIKSELKKNAFNYGVKYAKDLIDSNNKQVNFSRGFLVVLPEFNSGGGSKDAFSLITAKLTGFFTFFKTKEIGNITFPDYQRTFFVIPFSGGLETTDDFSFVNGIAEVGYFPWYWQPQSKVPAILRHTKAAIFLQSGYKFKTDSTHLNMGGNKDESNEPLNDAILRNKFILEIDSKDLWVNKSGAGIGLLGASNIWYNWLNNEVYYHLEGKFRLYLNPNYHLDFVYEKGSGAPNFNNGDQFGASLGISF
jgi:hypothetical protein